MRKTRLSNLDFSHLELKIQINIQEKNSAFICQYEINLLFDS